MARWGLRWILCWISVIVTACTQVASPTQTEKPQALTPINTLSPGASATPMRANRETETPADTRLVTNEPAADVNAISPRCFAILGGNLVCLGWLENQHNVAMSGVVIDVRLVDNRTGVTLDSQRISPAIDVIPAQERIPYRVIVDNLVDLAVGDVVVEIDVVEVPMPGSTRQVHVIDVVDLVSVWQGYDYVVSATLLNNTALPLTDIRVLTILEAEDGTLTGFRVMEGFESMATNMRQPLEMRVAPLDQKPATRVHVIVVGYQD